MFLPLRGNSNELYSLAEAHLPRIILKICSGVFCLNAFAVYLNSTAEQAKISPGEFACFPGKE